MENLKGLPDSIITHTDDRVYTSIQAIWDAFDLLRFDLAALPERPQSRHVGMC
jgi:hypothetical protein